MASPLTALADPPFPAVPFAGGMRAGRAGVRGTGPAGGAPPVPSDRETP